MSAIPTMCRLQELHPTRVSAKECNDSIWRVLSLLGLDECDPLPAPVADALVVARNYGIGYRNRKFAEKYPVRFQETRP